MKKLAAAAFLSACLLIPNMDALSQPAGSNPPQGREIVTAIDVTELMQGGSSEADIAAALSRQRGFDREAALRGGATDERVILYLIANRQPGKKKADVGEWSRRQITGDRYDKASQYKKAAEEFTRAILSSEDKDEPYVRRAEVYRKYLAARAQPQAGGKSNETGQPLTGRSGRLLCDAAYSDLASARRINGKNQSRIISEIHALTAKMKEQDPTYPEGSKVVQSRYVGGRNIKDTRQLNSLYNAQRVAHQAEVRIGRALADYKSVCETKEDAARLASRKIEKDRLRDKKWVNYWERDDSSKFYDPSGAGKSADETKVWTRHEDIHDEKTFDEVQVSVDCRQKTIRTIEFRSHDEMGTSTTERIGYLKKVSPETPEAALFRQLCK